MVNYLIIINIILSFKFIVLFSFSFFFLYKIFLSSFLIAKAKKTENCCCSQVQFLNIRIGWSEFFVFHYVLKHPKVQNLGAFSTFFYKKITTQSNKNWVLSRLLKCFILFFEMGWFAAQLRCCAGQPPCFVVMSVGFCRLRELGKF